MSAELAQSATVELLANHIRNVFEITDIDEPYSKPHGQSIHIFDPASETSLCGHVDEDAHTTSLASHADHEHSLVYDVSVCDHCTRSVRKRVRDDELTTGDDTLDAAIRADVGDDLVIETPNGEYHIMVEKTEFSICTVEIAASTDRDAPDGVEHWCDVLRVNVGPDGQVEVRHPYDLTEGPETTTGSVRFASEERPLVTDGGVATAEQTKIGSHAGREIVEYERGGDGLGRGVYCPDCGQEVTATKGAHSAPDDCEAGKIWGWECRDCKNTLPSNTHTAEARGFNDRIVGIKAEPRGGEERWIPVPVSSVDGGD